MFFNGLGRSLLLMYNLLLILLTLKGEHVDRDLTYEGLVGFDVMNTKLRDFLGGFVGFVLFALLYHSNQSSSILFHTECCE